MPDYTITAVEQTVEQSPTGGYVPAQKVYFRTSHGSAGFVVVPAAQFTPDRVAALVQERVDTIDAVYKLGQ